MVEAKYVSKKYTFLFKKLRTWNLLIQTIKILNILYNVTEKAANFV